jgi:hypothetical protein
MTYCVRRCVEASLRAPDSLFIPPLLKLGYGATENMTTEGSFMLASVKG